MSTLPAITTKQKEILKLLYKYRFLNRAHIQALLNHKDKRRAISWLKDLREKEYVDWHYDATDFIAKSRPAVYYLSLNGIRYLRETGEYPTEELRKRYKEPGRTQTFIDRCLLVADCCLALKAKRGGTLQYTWTLPADYVADSAHHSLNELKPHLYFEKALNEDITCYFLEVLDPHMPRYAIRKRIKDYVGYLADDVSGQNTPIILLVCSTLADLIYAKRRARKEIEDSELGEGEAARIRFSTLEKVQQHGIVSKIWEEA